MNDMSCPDRTQFGAYVSGELPPADEAVQRHIETCPTCAQEVRSLQAVVGALRNADLSRVGEAESFPTPLVNRSIELAIFDRIDRERKRTRLRHAAVSVAAALVLMIGVVGVGVLRGNRSADGVFVAMQCPIGGQARVELTQRKWGTEITIRTDGAPAGTTYGVWLERPDGSRVPAGSFTTVTVPSMTLRLSSGLQTDGATAFGMTDFKTKKEVRVLLSDATAKAP